MKFASLVSLVALYPQVAKEARFAVSCTGSARSHGNVAGSMRDNTQPLLRQVFVIDPAANTITRALEPRKEFDPVCASKNPDGFVSISAGLIQARSETVGADPVWRCEFELDRMSGRGEYMLRSDWSDGRYQSFEWNMVCAKSDIPVFDLTKRKF